MPLIDADALEADLKRQYAEVFGKARKMVKPEDFFIERDMAYRSCVVESEQNGFFAYLKTRPTIDAVPVVRCRDCVNWAGDPAAKPEYAGCWRYGAINSIIVHENGFCDKGKRRTGL